MKFLEGLDDDIKISLVVQLRNLWTHNSVAIEGNTLTLGETAFVIKEGLTIKGKPLKDHEEVVGHSTAIDLIFGLVNKKDPISANDLFSLHTAVQTQRVVDIYRPVGNWKKEPNRAEVVIGDDQKIIEYSPPHQIQELMSLWLSFLNEHMNSTITKKDAIEAYAKLHLAFVHIHPFYDGNGRMARLLSNLPVIKAGFPPIVILKTDRYEYIQVLANYQIGVGQIVKNKSILRENDQLRSFITFCGESWAPSMELVEKAFIDQKKRGRDQAST